MVYTSDMPKSKASHAKPRIETAILCMGWHFN
ncbi:hypothetical protein JOD43_001058 [Pullulanibacillus pueri]|nr:hypothetical protein [Pullulanibacillus pueri]